MNKLFGASVALFFLFNMTPFSENDLSNMKLTEYAAAVDNIIGPQTEAATTNKRVDGVGEVNEKKENILNEDKVIDKGTTEVQQDKNKIDKGRVNTVSSNKDMKVEKQDNKPLVTIHSIFIGENKDSVLQKLGDPIRKSSNDYGIEWNTYHQNYDHFFMVGYQDEKVAVLYTNQDVFKTTKGIKLSSTVDEVREAYGSPLETIQKNGSSYSIEDEEYDTYELDGYYVTFFYDNLDGQKVTAVQVITKRAEEEKEGYYGNPSQMLEEGFKWQMFDLINATRVKHGLLPLVWNDQIAKTAQHHSLDMADNDYFSHKNQHGKTPFDRITEDDIDYSVAGENIAMGQQNSIFAHEALMNSKSHRTNILDQRWTYLGVGVSINNEGVPYFTENYFTL